MLNNILPLGAPPDERVRQLRYKAGSWALGAMMILAATIGMIFMLETNDNKTGELLIFWVMVSGFYALATMFKSSRTVRDELSRKPKARQSLTQRLLLSLPMWFVYWFCLQYFVFTPKHTFNESLFYGAWMAVWFGALSWFFTFRKLKKKSLEE